jgi:hypothetical protein
VGKTVREGPVWISWNGDDLRSVVIGNPNVAGDFRTEDSPRSWRVGEVVVDVAVVDILYVSCDVDVCTWVELGKIRRSAFGAAKAGPIILQRYSLEYYREADYM